MDAAFFHLYLGPEAESRQQPAALTQSFPTPRDAVSYIMDTLPIVNGDYRTKRVILETCDAMQEAIRTGQPYQTRLDPPPGPPTDAKGNFIPVSDWDAANWPLHIHSPRP